MEVGDIFGGAESVRKDTQALVRPEPEEDLLVWDLGWLGHQESLEDFRDVSEIEEVVEFRRYGQQVLVDLVVHVNRGVHRRPRAFDGVGVELVPSQECLQDGGEDGLQGLVAGVGDVDDVEMPHEPGREVSSPSTWRSSGADEAVVIEFDLEELASLVNVASVDELPE